MSTRNTRKRFLNLFAAMRSGAVTRRKRASRRHPGLGTATQGLETRALLAVDQTFFVPFPENEVDIANEVLNTTNDVVHTDLGIVARSDGTVVYYDHWEDGFEADIEAPVQASTEVWGDNDPGNGMPPGFTSDLLEAGDVIVLMNDVAVNPRSPGTLYFDSPDKVAASGIINLSKLSYNTSPGSVLAGAVQAFDTTRWGTYFESPVGEDIASDSIFEYTALIVTAGEDNTAVDIDTDGNGTTDISVNLNQGQQHFVNGGVDQGATVITDKPVQTFLLTGDAGTSYESRWFELVPRNRWSEEYFTPVGSRLRGATTHNTDVWVYNPNAASITVNAVTSAGTTPLTIPSGAHHRFTMPVDSGGHFASTGGESFFAVTTIDSDAGHNLTYDWGFTLIPTTFLTPEVLIPLGLGSTDNSINVSPLWITSPRATTVYIDFDGDPSTGSATDPLGGQYDQAVTLTAFEPTVIVDSDNDASGARIYTVDGTMLSGAWGQDPATAPSGSPALDVGTTLLPSPVPYIDKESALRFDFNSNSLVDPGDVLEYSLDIRNTGLADATDVVVTDELPAGINYLPGTTRLDGVLIPDDGSGTPFPVDGAGYNVGSIPMFSSRTLTFEVLVDPLWDLTKATIDNLATADSPEFLEPVSDFNQTPVHIPPDFGVLGDVVWFDANGDGVQDAGEPGLAGVDVTARVDVNSDGIPDYFRTVTTAADGTWAMTNMPYGDYTVVVDPGTLPAGFTTQSGDPDGTNDHQTSFSLTLGAPINNNLDFGYRGPGSIGDVVFLDVDGNNTFDSGEGITGVDVRVTYDFDADGSDETLTVTTGADGTYLIPGLPVEDAGGNPVTHTVVVATATLPVNTSPSFDPDGTLDHATAVTISNAAPAATTADFGYRANGSIGDRIFLDANINGVWDPGEGLNNVDVTLVGDFDGDGVDETLTATTASDGSYLFGGLPSNDGAGGGITYSLTVDAGDLPAGVVQVADPDATPDNASTVTLTDASDTRLDQDFGYVGPGSIGDTLFVDLNGNGAPEPGEGLAGVTVTAAADIDGDGIDNQLTAVTDVNGNYLFSGLVTDDGTGSGIAWAVSVDAATLPPAVGLTPSVDPDATIDGSTSTTLTNAAPTTDTIDFGFNGPGTLGNAVFLDTDGDGVSDPGEGISGVDLDVTWFGPDGAPGGGDDIALALQTDADGFWSAPNLPLGNYQVLVDVSSLPSGVVPTTDPDGTLDHSTAVTLTAATPARNEIDFGYQGPGSIGDTVFLDINGNGLADPGEGLTGVDVTLSGDFDGDGTDETISTTTDADGSYLFEGLVTNDGTGGGIDYTVSVETADLPPGASQTVDPDGTQDDSTTVTLTDAAPNSAGQNYGYQGPGSIGDTVFLDINGNGLADPGEGLTGVDVTLSGDFDGDGTDETVSTTTDADGNYLFDGLITNDGSGGGITYTVSVDTSDLPAGVSQSVDPDATLDDSTTVTLTDAAPNSAGQNYGYQGPGSIGDTVFLDVNGNGVADPGEGLTGVDVTLSGDFDGDGTDETISTTTDADGNYLFDGLVTNDSSGGGITYTVSVDTSDLPAGVSQTIDPDGTLDDSTTVTLTDAAPNSAGQNYGYQGPGSIGDTVFLDINGNGLADPGEGLTGVDVTLSGDFDGDGTDETISTTTDADGSYLFEGLVTNDGTGGGIDYTVSVETADLPPGVSQTVDPDGTLDDSTAVTLTDAAPDSSGRNYGYQGPGSIGDTVFLDINGNGVADPGEGLTGVDVTLSGDFDGDGTDETVSTTTDADGNYLFDGLVTNDGSGGGITYTVSVDTSDLPAGASQTVDPDGTLDDSTTVTLTDAAPNSAGQNYGYQGPGSIGDAVFLDINGNGLADPGEGLTGVDVTLSGDFDGDGVDETVSTTTDADGNYLFDGLVTNDGSGGGIDYTVSVDTSDLPAGASQTVDPDGTLDDSTTVTLTDAAPTSSGQNYGYQGPGSIGDTVFLDINGNGLAGPDEGVPGIDVRLTGDFDGDGVDETVSTTTDADGNYLFDGLISNDGSGGGITYTVSVDTADLPPGSTQTADPDGTRDSASTVTLTAAAPDNTTLDFGYRGTGTIGDTVFLDTNGNGLADSGEGLSGIDITLTGDFDGDGTNETVSATTDSDGNYLFDGLITNDGSGGGVSYNIDIDVADLPPGVSQTVDPDGTLDNRTTVTLTDAAPNSGGQNYGYQGPGSIGDTVFLDVNGNGLADTGEGITGIDVTLTGDFDRDGLDETVAATTDVDGNYLFEGLVTNDGSGGGVSYTIDVDAADIPAGLSQTVDPDSTPDHGTTLTLMDATPDSTGQDFGYRGSGTIAEAVFLDLNNNGTVDPGEGIPGVDVTLTGDFDGDGIDETVTTTTDSNGNYLFDGLVTSDGAGGGITYTVSIDTSDLPVGASQTVDADGTLDNSSTVTLTSAAPDRRDLNFGYRGFGTIGDEIFVDENNNGMADPGEGVGGIEVTLRGDLDGDGVDELMFTTSAADGSYLFDGLVSDDGSGGPISYSITVTESSVPVDLLLWIDPDGGMDFQSQVALTPASPHDAAQDFGFIREVDLGVTKDNVDATDLAVRGEPVVYTIVVTNAGPGLAIDASVTDTFPTQTVGVNWTASGTAGTVFDAAGTSTLNETVTIPAGGAITYTVTTTLSPAFTGTLVNTVDVSPAPGVNDPDLTNNAATDTSEVVDMALINLDDPVAGTQMTLSSRGHTRASSLVMFVWGTELGSSTIDGVELGIADPRQIGIGFICSDETVEALFSIPDELLGETIYFQTYEIQPNSQTSNVLPLTLTDSGGVVSAGTLFVYGSESADDIDVVMSGTQVSVEIDGETSVFDATGAHPFDTVVVAGRGGEDNLNVDGTGFTSVIDGGAGDDTINGSEGPDSIQGGLGNDQISGDGGGDTIQGHDGDDVIVGTPLADSLFGGEGHDTISAAAGDDYVSGDAGDDSLRGSDGHDTLIGGEGHDFLIGGTHRDQLSGDGGNDTLHGNLGLDLLTGGEGDDLLKAGGSNDTVLGGAGNDTAVGGSGRDQIDGASGNDRLEGGTEPDTIVGEAGFDTIIGNAGHDVIDAGEGDDVVTGDSGHDTILGGSGHDTINGGSHRDYVEGGAGDDVIIGGRDFDTLLGGSGSDTLTGENGHDVLVGGDGADDLTGGSTTGTNRDILIGGNGADRLTGTNGQNLLISGATAYDESQAELNLIQSEWLAPTPVADRINNLRDGSGSTPEQNAGLYLQPNVTVFADSAVDDMNGFGDVDWFFAELSDNQDADLFDELETI